MRGICLTLALVLTSTLVMARSYFLPDYQGAGLEHRIQETDNQTSAITCSTYGLYNSIQSGMTCSVVYPASGLTCYTCSCDSVYKYGSADCPTPPYILSDQCKGKYKSCSCDTTLYPTTTTTGGCQYGFIPDINNYCEDKPDATKHYACVKPECKPDNITVEDCQAQGDGHNCTASKEANCTDYCDTNGCQDNCTYLTQTGQARSDCRYGCAAGKEVSGCADLCYECGDKPGSLTNTCVDIYDGKSNTTAIISQLGADVLAATAANQYYVGDKNGDFGQGKWYLPSIGELVDMYGTDMFNIFGGSGTSGATGSYLREINDALTTLYDKGVDTDILSDSYWSSSEHSANHVWTLTVSSANGSGNRSYALKDYSDHTYVRPFLKVEGLPLNRAIIGKVLYDDKTWDVAGRYYSGNGKKPVGIIATINERDKLVTIVSLKNLTFSTTDSSGNFDADNPYSGKYEESTWAPYDKREVNVTAVPNYSSDQLKSMLRQCTAGEAEIGCPLASISVSTVFDGKSNTQKIVTQLGEKGLAAYAATQFYVGDKNGTFGQGTWYLPAIGELIEMYGVDYSKITSSIGTSGVLDVYWKRINTALEALKAKGVEAEATNNRGYWSSSEEGDNDAWVLWISGLFSDGNRNPTNKDYGEGVRPFQLVENCFNPAIGSTPKIGDVMYEDKTWGSAEDYDGSKTPVGIVVAVSTVSGSVKIINLKDLTFSSQNSVGNFNPDDPYGGYYKTVFWARRKIGNINDLGDVISSTVFKAFRYCFVEW